MEKQKTEAIMAAYEKLDWQEKREIDKRADALIEKIKSKSTKGNSFPFSRDMAIELLGKVGMEMSRRKQ